MKRPEQIFRELLDRRLEISLERTTRGDYEGQVPVLDSNGRPSYGLLRILLAKGQARVEYRGLHLGTVGLRESLGEPEKIFLEYTLPTDGGLSVARVSLRSGVGLEAIVAATTVPAAPPAPSAAADIIEREERAGGERREPTSKGRKPTAPSLEGIPESLQTRTLEYLVGKLEQRIVHEGFYEPRSSKIKLGSELYSPNNTFSIREASSILGNTPAAIEQWPRNDSPLVKSLVVEGRMSASGILCVQLCDVSNTKTFDAAKIGHFFGIEEREAQYLVDVGFFRTADGKRQGTVVRGKFREVYDLAMHRLSSSAPRKKERPEDVPQWRTIPSFVEGKYDYGLRFQDGERKGRAMELFRLAYQDEFNRRLLEKLVLEGAILRNNLMFGKTDRRHTQGYSQKLSTADLAEILDVDKSKLNKMVRKFDNSLYREGTDGIYVSPFFALVWDDPFSTEGSAITSKPFRLFAERTLLDEARDEQLHSYLKSSGVLRQIHDSAVISCEDASVLYIGMASHWAATMRSDETRANLMKEVGYLTQEQMIVMLRSQEEGVERAYKETEGLRAKAVLGMIHFRDVSALLDANGLTS